VRLDRDRIRDLARERGYSLAGLLRSADVSRTAYYSLVRRPSVVPGTVRALARTLGVPAREIFRDDGGSAIERGALRVTEARAICRNAAGASFDGVWHALCLLDLPPIERLQRSLTRGRATPLHR
jgi:lambda repressor-like predicted transcriptional regulator